MLCGSKLARFGKIAFSQSDHGRDPETVADTGEQVARAPWGAFSKNPNLPAFISLQNLPLTIPFIFLSAARSQQAGRTSSSNPLIASNLRRVKLDNLAAVVLRWWLTPGSLLGRILTSYGQGNPQRRVDVLLHICAGVWWVTLTDFQFRQNTNPPSQQELTVGFLVVGRCHYENFEHVMEGTSRRKDAGDPGARD